MLGCPRGSASSARLFVPGERGWSLRPRGTWGGGGGGGGASGNPGGFSSPQWEVVKQRCPSVLLRAWARGIPGWLVALDAVGGGRTSGALSSPVNMAKEDGAMDPCPASRCAGCHRALSHP